MSFETIFAIAWAVGLGLGGGLLALGGVATTSRSSLLGSGLALGGGLCSH